MHRAIAIATLTTVMVACSPYAKRDKDEAKKDAAVAVTKTATVAKTATTAAVKPLTAPPAVKDEKSPIQYVSVRIEKSVEDAMVDAIGKENGTPLSQIAMRVLVWWIDVRKEFRKGDRLELAYEVKGGETDPILLHAVWFTSQKLGKTMAAVSYKAKDQQFARWYLDTGEEVEMRLEGGPIDFYEQVTSLLNDGRRHKGVDFKTPVGTPVKAPFDGVIVKKNWGRGNGNCLEIEDAKTGYHAKLLHLDHIPPEYTIGKRVKHGEEVAKSGNTGHSTAPHLHYQLEAGTRLLDPFKIHKTYRTTLPPAEAEKVKAALAKLAALRTGAQ